MDFRNVDEHIEVYIGNRFVFSADTLSEAHQIAKEMEDEWR